jgi:predicted amidophosphoribosyltransferase
LLVDDVMTTGATLDEGVRALESAGWHVVGVSVVASVDARSALAPGDRLR